MNENHVTYKDFNCAMQGIKDEQKIHLERLVRVETKVDTFPQILDAKNGELLAKLEHLIMTKNQGLSRWIVGLILPLLLAAVGYMAVRS